MKRLMEGGDLIINEANELIDKRLHDKWVKTGLLQGLEEDKELSKKIARLLENQAAYFYRNAMHLGTDEEAMDFINVIFPAIRRVFGTMQHTDWETGEYFDMHDDWHVMSLPVHYDKETDTAINASTYKLETRLPSITELAKHTYANRRIDAEVEAIGIFTEAVAKELIKRWKNQKIHVYVPFILNDGGVVSMRWASQKLS